MALTASFFGQPIQLLPPPIIKTPAHHVSDYKKHAKYSATNYMTICTLQATTGGAFQNTVVEQKTLLTFAGVADPGKIVVALNIFPSVNQSSCCLHQSSKLLPITSSDAPPLLQPSFGLVNNTLKLAPALEHPRGAEFVL